MRIFLRRLRSAVGSLLRAPPGEARRRLLAAAQIEARAREAPFALEAAEPSRPDNFFAAGCLLANLDLQRKFGSDESAAREHFERHGRNENRLQIARDYLHRRDAFFAEKFDLFKDALTDKSISAFPAFIGAAFCDLENYEGESANGVTTCFTEELVSNPQKLYADIGAGLRNLVFKNCVCVEVYPSLTSDIIIEPACELPFETASLDGLGCFAVLEHVDKPWKMAEEFARVVKPGGKIFIDWPFLQPAHGCPSHFFNATREGVRSLFSADFATVDLHTGPFEGPNYTVSFIIDNLVRSIGDEAARERFMNLTVRELRDMLPTDPAWLPILESLDDEAIARLSCGNTFVGLRKADAQQPGR